MYNGLKGLQTKLILPEPAENSKPSWFGFLITCKEDGLKQQLIKKLEENKIQTRALFAGNLIKHPCFDSIRNTDAYRVSGTLEITDRIMNNTFWIGVYPGMTDVMLNKMIKTIEENV